MGTKTRYNWGTTTHADLRRSAFEHRHLTSSFEWLKEAGFVPQDQSRMDIRQVLTDLDPQDIDVAYVAAAAYEWDTWGEASPVDFVRALGFEMKGAKRDLIVETLMSLGREMAQVAA